MDRWIVDREPLEGSVMLEGDTQILEKMACLVVILDREGRIQYWNQANTELTGYSLDEARGLPFWDLASTPQEAAAVRALWAGLSAKERFRHFGSGWTTKNDDQRWLAWSIAVVPTSDGEVDCALASGIDISDRKELEKALEAARLHIERKEAYLRGIFENTQEFIGLLSPDGTLLEANRSALEFVAARREQVLGRPFWKTPWWRGEPELQEKLRSAIAEAAEGHEARFEAKHRSPDGRTVHVDFSLTPVRDARGRVVLIVPEGRDITARKRSEAAQRFLAEAGAVLTGSLEYRETVCETANLAVRFVADCCMVDLVEEGQVRRLCVAHAESPKPWFARVLEEMTLDRNRPHLTWEVLATKRSVLLADVPPDRLEKIAQNDEHRRAIAALKTQSVMGVPLLARGRLLGMIIFVSSRPERRYGAEDLALAEELARRAALAIDNARLYRTAQQALQARDEVLGIVAHDLRNPLTTISLAATLLRQALPASAEESGRRAIDTILRSAAHAGRLIQDLLEVRRITAGHLALEPEALPTTETVLESAEAQRRLARLAGLELQLDVAQDLPPIWADRSRIMQVFDNIVGNAIKFTPAGGRVCMGVAPRQNEVLFWVTDSGPGISAEDEPHLFDLYWQASKGDSRGAGLGLPIAREIIEAHRGRIWVESKPGSGSTFFFTVPTATRG